MRVLVLGGTGAIGSHLSVALAKKGHEVVVTSRSPRRPKNNLTYVHGDAHRDDFLTPLLVRGWQCIVDFLNYQSAAFASRVDGLLASSEQYLFLSSSRVFAESAVPITEDSARLLDVTTDRRFLESDEYAIAKARQEDLLFRHRDRNWTIIRPYITYDAYRLQLGILEKEEWLARVLRGGPILFPCPMLDCRTTMTSGRDVAQAIVAMVGEPKAYGQAFNVTSRESHTWQDVLDIYVRLINDLTGDAPRVHLCDLSAFEDVFPRHYQIHCDRLFNRVFNNERVVQLTGGTSFSGLAVGLRESMTAFFSRRSFRYVDYRVEGKADRVAGHWMSPLSAPSARAAIRYLRSRLLP
jgi:nucleoside-diphosphate-sugar epimerase